MANTSSGSSGTSQSMDQRRLLEQTRNRIADQIEQRFGGGRSGTPQEVVQEIRNMSVDSLIQDITGSGGQRDESGSSSGQSR